MTHDVPPCYVWKHHWHAERSLKVKKNKKNHQRWISLGAPHIPFVVVVVVSAVSRHWKKSRAIMAQVLSPHLSFSRYRLREGGPRRKFSRTAFVALHGPSKTQQSSGDSLTSLPTAPSLPPSLHPIRPYAPLLSASRHFLGCSTASY